MLRCSACPTNDTNQFCSRPILPTGPSGRCDYLFLGAGPGRVEAKTLRTYSGLAGDELTDLYLPLAGLRRDQIVLGNVSLCWDGTDRTPSDKRIAACAHSHLPALLDRVQPTVVVLMGAATQSICDRRIRLDLHHGLPQYTSLLNGAWEGWCFPMYEPALGMRDTGMMTPLMTDFKRLGEWMRGEWAPEVQREEKTDYQLCDTPEHLRDYLSPLCMLRGQPINIAEDTENHGPDLWSIQISHMPGTGRLIRTNNLPVIRELAEFNRHFEDDLVWIMHWAQHDLDATRRAGIEFKHYRCTMQEAYHLCSVPQGLKQLVYRLFGHEMRGWEQTVWPASIAVMRDWLNRAIEREFYRPLVTTSTLKMGKCPSCGKRNKRLTCSQCDTPVSFEKREESPNAIESTLRHILRYTESDEEKEKPYNPWKKIPEMREGGLRGKVATSSEWDDLMAEVGELPLLGIGNCDEATAVQYAVGDADWCLRVAGKLEELRADKRWTVDEADYDE